MRSLREAREASSSGKDCFPIQNREIQKATVRRTHFQIRSEAHGAYILLWAVIFSAHSLTFPLYRQTYFPDQSVLPYPKNQLRQSRPFLPLNIQSWLFEL